MISIPFHNGKTFLSFLFQRLVPFSLSKHITKLLQRAPIQLGLLPQIRCKEAVGIAHRHEGRFEGIFESFCGTGWRCVDVLDAGELEKALYSWGSDEASTAGGGDELFQKKKSASYDAFVSKAFPAMDLYDSHTLTVTEPHFPLSLVGREWGSPRDVPQYPRRIGRTLSLAMMIAARIAVATSFAVLMPRPTCPSESPITTIALNRVRWPARVCFCTGLIYSSHSGYKPLASIS